jgi:hypothetical protein
MNTMQIYSAKLIVAGFVLPALLLATGCKRESIKTYRIAKDQDQMQAQAAPALSTDTPNPKLPPGHPDISTMPATAGAPATGAPAADQSGSPQLTWTTPTGWTEQPPTELRVASFKVAGAGGKSADVSVIPLGGMAGTDSANVNRWRGQVGLKAVTDSELQASAQNVEASGSPAQLYDVAGENPASGESTRIIGVIQHRPDSTWFYKMTGDADLVEQQKPAFIEFLKSLKFPAATASQGAGEMPSTLPPGHPAIGDMNAAAQSSAPISHEGQPNWQVPAGWQEVSGGQFLVGKFLISNGAAAVNVSSSVGDGGGLAANVNRWRGQLGLQPNPEVLTAPVLVSSGTGGRVDLVGTNVQTGKPAKLVGVIVTQSDRTWIYKLMGDPAVVDAQTDAFIKFVQSAKY